MFTNAICLSIHKYYTDKILTFGPLFNCINKKTMNYTIKEDNKFQFIEEGEGHVLMLLHGLFGALSNFMYLIEYFRDNYKVVVPLLPIYSLPIRNTDVYNLGKFVDNFVRHRGYKDITLLGNSLGGHVALVCSAKYPEYIHSTVLTGSSGLYENAFGGSYPRKGDKKYLKEKIAITFYDPKFATDKLVDECYDLVNDRNKLVRIIAQAKSAIRHNMADDLPNIKMPVCLIWGRNDPITPPPVAEEFNTHLPNSDLFWIDKCGHAPMMECPEKFNDILDKWLNELLSGQDQHAKGDL